MSRSRESLSAEDPHVYFARPHCQSSPFMQSWLKDLEAQSRRQAEGAGVTM